MVWIKRNLYFLIFCLVALGLMGWGGYYLWSKISEESEVADKIKEAYNHLQELGKQNPHPGEAGVGKVDNVQAAKDQDKALKEYIKKAHGHFQRPTPIPDSAKVGNAEFATQLPNTIAQLSRAAQQASVQFPNNYYFSFEAQRRLMTFDTNSLDKLAVSLGEIKALCDILFSAKINYLELVKREMLSPSNENNTMGDYISLKTISTPLAEITPYELDFRCFSSELAAVLSGIANSPYCIIVKTVNVEPSTALPVEVASAEPVAMPQPTYTPPPQRYFPPSDAGMDRYKVAGPRYIAPTPAAPVPVQNVTPAAKAAPFLIEKQLRVVMQLEIVKLKAQK